MPNGKLCFWYCQAKLEGRHSQAGAWERAKLQLQLEMKNKELALQQREIALKDKEISHLEELLEMHKNSTTNPTE